MFGLPNWDDNIGKYYNPDDDTPIDIHEGQIEPDTVGTEQIIDNLAHTSNNKNFIQVIKKVLMSH